MNTKLHLNYRLAGIRVRSTFFAARRRGRRFWRSLPAQARWALVAAFMLGLAGQQALTAAARLPGWVQAWFETSSNPALPPVRVASAQIQEMREEFSVFTTLLPQREAVLRPPSQVVVAEVLAKIGDPIRQGQPLVRFRSDAQNLRAELEQIDLARKEMDIELTLALSKKNFVSGRELKQSELDQKATRIRRKLNDAESLTVMRSPIDGIMAELNLFPGDYIDQVQNYTVRIVQPDGLRAQIYVPNSISSRLAKGGAARIALADAESGERTWVDAQVNAVGATIDPKTGSVFVDVETSENPDHWRAGSLAELRLVIQSNDAATVIPESALVMRKGVPHVFRIVETEKEETQARAPASVSGDAPKVGQVELVPVKLGIRSGEAVEISEGIEVGQQVVIRGQSILDQGKGVQIVE